MTVMVMVTPGSEPPITPTKCRQQRHQVFPLAMLTRPFQSKSSIRNPSSAAWQQHQQVSFEDEIAHRGGAERDRGERRPLPRVRGRPTRLQRADEQHRGDAISQQRQQRHIGGDDCECDHDQAIVSPRRVAPAGYGRRAMPHEVLQDQQRARGRHEGQHNRRVKTRPDRNNGKRRKLEGFDQQDQADREQDQPGNSVAADAHFLIRPRSVMTTLFSLSILARNCP